MKNFSIVFSIFLLSFGLYAQDDAVLIAHDNYLVGAAQNGKWIKDTELSTNTKKTMKFLGFDSFKNEKPSEIFGAMDVLGCGANYFYFGKTNKIPENIFDETTLKPVLAIGANANWNPLPRTAKKLALTGKTYQKIALDFLKTKGIIAKTIKLENAFSVDLEGDGKEEIFIEATNQLDKEGNININTKRGDYSFVMMRKTIGGKPKDFLIEGEFYPTKPVENDYVTEVGLSAFADLNGDGKMEVVLGNFYSYGGNSTEIYESEKNVLKKVLSVECGD